MPNGTDLSALNQTNALVLQRLGEFFTSIANEKDAGRLLEAMIARDAVVFGEYVKRFRPPEQWDFPKLGLCWWIWDVITISYRHPPKLVNYWAVQLPDPPKGLAGAKEWNDKIRQYWSCTAQYGNPTEKKTDAQGKVWTIVPDLSPLPSPLLDCLRQAGLAVQIAIMESVVESYEVPAGRAERVCV